MKIFINALSAKQGGGQTYVRNLLSNVPEDCRSTIYVIAPESLSLPTADNIIRLPVRRAATNNPYIRTVWEALVLPRLLVRLGIDVLFCPGGAVPNWLPRGCKVVTTFQNMMPFDLRQRAKYPLGLMRLRNWILERTLLAGMLRSNLVIFISEFAKSVIDARVGQHTVRGVVIPHGIDSRFRLTSSELPRPSWLPKSEYFLYVSTLDVYKAQVEVVEAYSIFRRTTQCDTKLVLVGPEYKPYAEKVHAKVAELGLQENVLIIGNVPHHELPAAYQHAKINIYASETENCPFILLEALCAGRPMLVSSRPPMPEFAGDAVMYFDPSRPDDLARGLESIMSNNALQEELGRKAFDQAEQYRWEATGKKTWQEISRLSESSARERDVVAA
jgi:glycosyltransferase involved in cell wall biosynthesis